MSVPPSIHIEWGLNEQPQDPAAKNSYVIEEVKESVDPVLNSPQGA